MLAVVLQRACASTAEPMAMAVVRCGCEGEGRKQEMEMWCWEAHGRTLWLQLVRSGPMWPKQAGGRQHVAPRGGELL